MRRVPPGGAARLSTGETWGALLDGAAEVAYRETSAGRSGQTETLPAGLHPAVADALARRGITDLYAHQAETWEAAARGRTWS